jgi:hypothetical protein
MAKLRLPLLSLEARGALGESIVFFPWKGINAARKYVIPANPRTQPQLTQRGYITDIVALVHTSQGRVANPLNAGDTIAYSLYSRTLGKVMTWFNAVVKQCIEQKVATLHYSLLKDGTFTPGVDQVTCHLSTDQEPTAPNNITAGTWHWGTSPTALNNSVAATVVAPNIDNVIAGLTTGTKYYFQFRASAHVDYLGVRSGIYFATPL